MVPSDLTRTWRKKPVRSSCARPSASFASVLLIRQESAALAWRASMHTTGRPASASPWQSQVASMAGLEPDPLDRGRVPADGVGQGGGIGRARAAPEAAALLVHDVHAGRPQRDVEGHVLGHAGSPIGHRARGAGRANRTGTAGAVCPPRLRHVSTRRPGPGPAARRAAAAGCDTVHGDRGISGEAADRPGLAAALADCASGDVLVVWKLDRLGRSNARAVRPDAGPRPPRHRPEGADRGGRLDRHHAAGRQAHILAVFAAMADSSTT